MFNEIILPIFFGIVQGLTEFLPVSSSGHLVVMHDIFQIDFPSDSSFDVTLHLATLLAVSLFFRGDLIAIVKSFFKKKGEGKEKKNSIGWHLLAATIPAALAGYFFEDVIEGALRSPWIVALMLAAVGFFFIIVEKIYQAKLEDYQAIGFKRCLVIGFAQALALIPGTSRSGITIICGMALGVKRQEAVKFSFLLSIPIIFGAVIVKISDFSIIEALSRPVLPLAFLSAFLSGFFSIKYLIKYAENHRLNAFAYYRFLLALIIIINLFFF